MACVVLTGEVSGSSPPAEVWSHVAQAFNLDLGNFENQVLSRAPLIIRRNLDQAAAATYVQRLSGLGAEVVMLDDDPDLVEIDRAGKRLGPIPAKDIERFLRDGDRYRVRGLDAWATWPASRGSTAEPLTLDTFEAESQHTPASVAGAAPDPAKPAPPPITPQPSADSVPLPPWLVEDTVTKPTAAPTPANHTPAPTPSKPVTPHPPGLPPVSRQEEFQDASPSHYRHRQGAPRSGAGHSRRGLWIFVFAGVLVCIGLAVAAWWFAIGRSHSSVPAVASSQPAPSPASQTGQDVAKTTTRPVTPDANAEVLPQAAPVVPITSQAASPNPDTANTVPAATTSAGTVNQAIADNAVPGTTAAQSASNDGVAAPVAASTVSPPVMVAPSFDCNRASTSVEIAICASPKLRALDAQMGALYTRTMATIPVDDAAGLKQSQIQWIRERQQQCDGNAHCIETMLRNRISALQIEQASEPR